MILCFQFLRFALLGTGLLAASPAVAAEKLTLMLDWFVNPDHAPIIVADKRGYFAERGLEVEIIAPADPNDPPKLVAAGQADIAISYQPQLHIQKDQGLPLPRIGTLVATPLNTLMVLDDGPIDEIADLKGGKIGYLGRRVSSTPCSSPCWPAHGLTPGRRRADQRQLRALAGAALRPGRRRDRRVSQLRAQPARPRRQPRAAPSTPRSTAFRPTTS